RTGAAERLVAVVALARQDGRWTFLDLVHPQRHEADYVFIQAELALHFGDEGRGRIQAEQHVVALAVRLHAIGQAAETPVFALLHRPAVAFDELADLIRQVFHLLLRDIVARDQHAFIERHVSGPFGWRPAQKRA